MDKLPNRERKISIKINGVEKPFREPIHIRHWQGRREMSAAREETRPAFNSWQSAEQTGQGKRKKFRFLLPFFRRRPLRIGTIPGKKGFRPAFALAVTSAISVGLLLGFALMKAMVDENDPEAVPADTQPAGGGVEEGMGPMVLPELTVLFLQQGVYSNGEAVEKLVKDFQEKGYAAIFLQDGGQFRVFVSAVGDMDSGKAMREMPYYKQAYEETWPKEMKSGKKILQDVAEKDRVFLEQSVSLYKSLIRYASQVFFHDGKPGPELAGIQEIKKKIRSFEGLERGEVRKLRKSLLEAADAMEQYAGSRNREDWSGVQQHLLDFAAGYWSL